MGIIRKELYEKALEVLPDANRLKCDLLKIEAQKYGAVNKEYLTFRRSYDFGQRSYVWKLVGEWEFV